MRKPVRHITRASSHGPVSVFCLMVIFVGRMWLPTP